jgi:hypothetical protein
MLVIYTWQFDSDFFWADFTKNMYNIYVIWVLPFVHLVYLKLFLRDNLLMDLN